MKSILCNALKPAIYGRNWIFLFKAMHLRGGCYYTEISGHL